MVASGNIQFSRTDNIGKASLTIEQPLLRFESLLSRKMDDNPVDDELRVSIRSFCESLVSALNKYYAFGSCFTDDYT